jgi:hypothetical protein
VPVYIPILAILAFKLSYLLNAEPVGGWDTTPHLYLAHLMSGYLLQGKISGWDENWYAGYPAFSLYPPFGYIVLLIPWIISLGAISVTLSFNLMLYILPFLLLISAIYIGEKRGSPSLGFFAGLGFLLIPGTLGSFGSGVYGFLVKGNIHGLLGFILLLFLLDELFGKKRIINLSALFSLLILTHLLSAIFFSVVFIFRFIFWPDRKRLFISGIITAICTSFWTIPFLKLLPQASGEMMESFKDPLFLLFSDLSPEHFKRFLLVFDKLNLGEKVAGLPWISILVLVIIISYLERFKFDALFSTFIFCLILVPRNIFTEFIDTAIHYYRFAPMLWVFVILMATRLKLKNYLVAVPFIFILLFRFDLTSPTELDPHPPFPGRLSNAPGKKVADEIVQYFRDNPPKGRVIEEVVTSNLSYLGSPHLFSTRLPMELGIKMGTGLLAESALCSEAFQAPLAALTRHKVWGGGGRWLNKSFLLQPSSVQIQRLQFLGVSHVIVSSAKGKRIFRRFRAIKSVYSSRALEVFELPSREFLAAPFKLEVLEGNKYDVLRSIFFNRYLFQSPPILNPQDIDIKGVIIVPGLAPKAEVERKIEVFRKRGLDVIVIWGDVDRANNRLEGKIPITKKMAGGSGSLIPPCFVLG